MSCRITPRYVDGVTILECVGRFSLGEGAALLRDEIKRHVLAGRNQILLLLADISYIDSSGVGELVSGFTTVANSGGQLKLLSPTKRVVDCLQITKLYTVFEVFDDENTAVRSYTAASYLFTCPVCQGSVRSYGLADLETRDHPCGACDVRFRLSPADASTLTARVRSMAAVSYSNESIIVRSGRPYIVSIEGRLNLFSSRALRKLWLVIPSPRRLIVDLALAVEIDESGRNALFELVSNSGRGAKVAISTSGFAGDQRRFLPPEPPFFESFDLAKKAMGDVSDTPELLITLTKY